MAGVTVRKRRLSGPLPRCECMEVLLVFIWRHNSAMESQAEYSAIGDAVRCRKFSKISLVDEAVELIIALK